jgi:hypothetical protein
MTANILTKALRWERFERFRLAAGFEEKDFAHLGKREY